MNLSTSIRGLLMVSPAAVFAVAIEPAPVENSVEFRLAEESAGDGLEPFKMDDTDRQMFLHPESVLSRSDIANVCFETNEAGRNTVSVNMTDSGAEKLSELSKNNLGKHLAVVLNDRVVLAPRIMSEMRRSARLDGRFSDADLHAILDALVLSSRQDADGTERSVDDLLREHRDTLLAHVKAVEAKHQSGNLAINAVIAARSQLLASELALAKSKAARLGVLEKRLENARQLEAVAEEQYAAGQGDQANQLHAKAARLRAEIDLVREQAKAD